MATIERPFDRLYVFQHVLGHWEAHCFYKKAWAKGSGASAQAAIDAIRECKPQTLSLKFGDIELDL